MYVHFCLIVCLIGSTSSIKLNRINLNLSFKIFLTIIIKVTEILKGINSFERYEELISKDSSSNYSRTLISIHLTLEQVDLYLFILTMIRKRDRSFSL